MKNKFLLILALLTVTATSFFYFKGTKQKAITDPLVIEKIAPVANSASFKFESFNNRQPLQEQLNKLFPFGADISDIDAVLVNKAGAYRSDNLINFTGKDENYKRGDSSADNFIFYYKPVSPAGNNGWEDTSSGWVVKVIHGNFPREGDKDIQVMTGGSGKGLKQIIALTAPGEQQEGVPDENITLAKELLQYKIDLTPVETFDEKEWLALVESHKNSPCIKELTYQCLMQQTLHLLNIPNDPARRSYLKFLADMVIEHGDSTTAGILLKVWPIGDDIRKYEMSMPRLQRMTPNAIENTILGFHIEYIQLLFLAGNYDEAEKLLTTLHQQQKDGSDYGAINALVKRGDLEQAFKIAQKTLEWKREVPDPKENSSAHMHCNTYTNPKTRPAAMGDLALAYIKKGNSDKAYEIAKLARHYWENKAFGQSSFCYIDFAKGSYINIMQALIEDYSTQNNKEKARAIFEELRSVFQAQTETIRRYNKGSFEQLARTAAKSGITDSLEDMAAFVQTHSEMDYPEVYRESTNDPVPLIYALSGNYQKATDYIEKFNYTENRQPPSQMDKLLDLKETPDEEIRLTTYLKIARTLANVGDKEGALLFLEKATPYLGKRNPEYDPAVTNLSDYIDKANILLDLEEKEKSREALNDLLLRFNKTQEKDYRGGDITKGFYGSLAYLYARHDSVEAVQKWADKLPSYYSGSYYSRIAELLIKEKRWDELNEYFDEMSDVLSTDDNFQNWRHFAYALIKAEEFDRYLRFINMLDEGSSEARERQKTNRKSIDRKDRPKTPDTKQQIWLMNQLLVSKLAYDKVPVEVIETIWPRYVTNCQSWEYVLPRYGNERNKKPDAREVMASCYVGIIQGLESYNQFNELIAKRQN